MKYNALLSEGLKVDAEVMAVTTAAASTSRNYDMRDYQQALVNVCIETTVGISTVTVDLMESSAATVAGSSAAGSKAGMVLGGASTLLSTAGGVRKMTLTMSSATANEYFYLKTGNVSKKFINTTSTVLHQSSAWVSTALYFGSTVGSTVNTGIALSIDSLKTAIASTLAFGNSLILSTGTTASILIEAADNAVGNLGLSASAVMTQVANQAVGAFNISADQLDSTANKRYVSVKVSSASEIQRAAVTVIRSGGSYMPPTFSGKLST